VTSILDEQSNISSDDFGLNTGGSVSVGAGGNITIANAQGNGASIGASGNAGVGVQLFTGAGGLLSLNAPNPAALFSTSGNVTANANRLASLTQRSPIIKELVDAKQLTIAAAMHDITAGKVTWLS
jgi:hypothetical protein